MAKRQDWRNDLAAKDARCFGARDLGVRALLGRGKNRATVRRPAVTELPAAVERIVMAPEMTQQLGVGNARGIVGYAYGLGMTFVIAVGGVGKLAAGIARNGADDAIKVLKITLHAPKTAASEYCFGARGMNRLRRGLSRVQSKPSDKRQHEDRKKKNSHLIIQFGSPIASIYASQGGSVS